MLLCAVNHLGFSECDVKFKTTFNNIYFATFLCRQNSVDLLCDNGDTNPFVCRVHTSFPPCTLHTCKHVFVDHAQRICELLPGSPLSMLALCMPATAGMCCLGDQWNHLSLPDLDCFHTGNTCRLLHDWFLQHLLLASLTQTHQGDLLLLEICRRRAGGVSGKHF